MQVKIRELSHIYAKSMPYEKIALDNINLDLDEGRFYFLIGKTGSGKSTLVQHLNALLLPHKGSIEILDYKIEAEGKKQRLKDLRGKVGLVFQFSEYQLFEETILKDVAFGPLNFNKTQDEAISLAKKALKLVGIDESLYDKSPFELSGGQKRKVAIAGILALEPKILVLDEPTAGLDPLSSKELLTLLKNLNEKDTTIIAISHDNEIVYEYADEVIFMHDSRLITKMKTLDFFTSDLIAKYNIVLPKLLEFKTLLKQNGFKITGDDYDTIIKEIVRQINE